MATVKTAHSSVPEQELAWAAMNYLEWRDNPRGFTCEPVFLLARATLESLRKLKTENAVAQLRMLESIYTPEKMQQLEAQLK